MLVCPDPILCARVFAGRDIPMFRFRPLFCTAVCVLFLSACAHKALPPQPPGAPGPSQSARKTEGSANPTSPPAWGLVSNGGSMQSFGDAKGLPLTTDADYGRFVDPAIIGPDRALAIKLLEIMPPQMRGDFVYVDKNRRVLSNRLSLESEVHFIKSVTQSSVSRQAGYRSSATIRPMSYPPLSCSGGPCLRFYSYQGVNAAYGYASFPCDSVYKNGDDGNMYFNAYDSNGNDVVDAGIGQGVFPNNSQTENAFINVGGYYQYQSWNGYTGWTNETQTWQCGLPPIGTPLGIMYGTLPASLSNGSQNLSFLAVGVPDFDPTQMQMPPSQATWNHSAWDFFDTPPTLLGSAGTWEGIPSPCMFCSVGRMLTIAQNPGTPINDGSCFGACQAVPAARWDEVVMGEIISPCGQIPGSPPSATCTIEYPSNGAWQNGGYYPCNGGIFYSEYNQQDALEGINTNYTNCNSGTSSQTAFRSPLPTAPSSPCTADSYGYCSIEVSRTAVGSCNTGYPSPHGGYIYETAYDTKYDIFKMGASGEMLELQEIATQVESIHSSQPCDLTISWSPNDPKTYYNDSNLP